MSNIASTHSDRSLHPFINCAGIALSLYALGTALEKPEMFEAATKSVFYAASQAFCGILIYAGVCRVMHGKGVRDTLWKENPAKLNPHILIIAAVLAIQATASCIADSKTTSQIIGSSYIAGFAAALCGSSFAKSHIDRIKAKGEPENFDFSDGTVIPTSIAFIASQMGHASSSVGIALGVCTSISSLVYASMHKRSAS